jgi:multisubunit Na+/H+ antiporter MnhE subunit
MPSPARDAVARTVWIWLAWWGGSMVIWLLLTTTWAGAEAVAGVVASVVAATAATIVHLREPARFRPRFRWLRHAWPIALRIASESWRAFGVLLGHVSGRRRVRGRLLAVPFRHGGESARDHARRALATAGLTMTPNSVVIGIDEENDEILVHQLWADDATAARLGGNG